MHGLQQALLDRTPPAGECPKCGGTLNETEERRRETKAGFATQKECQAAMNKLLVKVEAHNYTAPSKATVREYLTKEWLPAVKATIRPSTYSSYVQHVECHIAPAHRLREARQAHGITGQRPLREARRDGCQGWHAGLSAMTIHHVHSCLHKACKDAVRWGHIARNPLDAADPPRKKGDGTREMKTWTRSSSRRSWRREGRPPLCPLAHDRHDRHATRRSPRPALVGRRPRERPPLGAPRPDPHQQRRRCLRAEDRQGQAGLALDPVTVEVLKAQAARQLDEQSERHEGWVETGLVFTAENGAALDPESVSRYWRQAVKKAMLPPIRLHDLRHTHATLALQAGIHPKVVSERLGHATVSITLDTYSHAIPAMQEEAAVLIAGLVFTGT